MYGLVYIRKVQCGAGAIPITDPLPNNKGLMYNAPFPWGGTCMHVPITKLKTHDPRKKRKGGV